MSTEAKNQIIMSIAPKSMGGENRIAPSAWSPIGYSARIRQAPAV